MRLGGAAVQRAGLHSSAAAAELRKFTMPAMSPTMQDGGIAAWKKKPGEEFHSGDVLLEIETDKATMEVEAQDDGVLAKIIADAGAKHVPVNTTIAIVGEEGDDLSGADALAEEARRESASASPAEETDDKKEKPAERRQAADGTKPARTEDQGASAKKSDAPKQDAPAARDAPSGPDTRSHVFATPIARRLAQERGIPLAKVKGTGPHGRIIKEDIDNFAPAAAPGAAAPSGAPAAAYTDTPLSNMRRTIATRLSESKSTVPHYYVTADVDMGRASQLREVFNRASAEGAHGDAAKAKAAKLSVNDFIIKACAIALKAVPEANSAWHGEFIREHRAQDISVAVSTPNGLITPIVRNCGEVGLADIAAQSKALAKKARDSKLRPEEYQGGTFTVSNMGMMGVSNFTAIINPPQSCILAIGTTGARIVPDASEERGWRTAQIMEATLSADHRVVDGATAARWMQAFKAALENPLSFML
ncbi:dihydrolipoyllysine-residue acetyltransferase [Malassezia sp. CBS 17886]|nr:dihydrolipoyllysine-residue acetyltransferase [Malassezia sp. CBS 17886]